MSPTPYEAQKDALEALRPLVTAEELRSTNLNARALGIISASSVVTAIAAFFAKDVLAGEILKKLDWAEKPAVYLLIAAVVLLVSAVACGVYTLLPRTRYFILPDGIDKWKSGEALQDGETIRAQTIKDLAGLLGNLREFNGGKVRRLNTTYGLYAAAVVAIGIDACAFFGAAL